MHRTSKPTTDSSNTLNLFDDSNVEDAAWLKLARSVLRQRPKRHGKRRNRATRPIPARYFVVPGGE